MSKVIMKLGLNKHIRIYSDGSVYHMGLSDPYDVGTHDSYYEDYVENICEQNKIALRDAIQKYRDSR